MSDGNFIDAFAGAVDGLFEPLLAAVDDPTEIAALAGRAGWSLHDADSLPVQALADAKEAIRGALAVLTDGDLDTSSFAGIAAGLAALSTVFTAVRDVRADIADGFGVTVDAATLDAFSADLLNLLILQRLHRVSPAFAQVLRLLGIIEAESLASWSVNGTDVRTEVERSILRPSNIAALLTTPADHLRAAYLPDGFASEAATRAFVKLLFERVRALAIALGGDTYVGLEGATPTELADPANAAALRTASLRLPLPGGAAPVPGTVGVVVTALPAGVSGRVGPTGPGFELIPSGMVTYAATFGDWSLELVVTGSTGATFVSDTQVVTEDGGAGMDIAVTLAKGVGGGPALRIGGDAGTRLEVGRIVMTGHVTLSAAEPDWGFGIALEEAALVIAAGDADTFLASLLPGDGMQFDLDLGLGWSKVGGLRLAQATGLDVTVPLDLSILGLIDIQALRIAIAAADTGLDIGLGVTAAGALGPFTAIVDGIGIAADVTFPANSTGNLGPIDLSLGFKPPDGIGLDVEIAGVVTGGGYLFIDADKGEYAGVVDMDMLGVGITAIGLISTRLPDGSDGWSMFLSLSAQFTGVQLGFGFTLNGVGGLIGVNRTMDEDALGEGVRTGALDSILFPDDPVVDAPRILADLGAVFPAKAGQYVFGPIAKIGWGTPTLVEVDLGVIIQLPEPLTVTILGALSAVLPAEDAPVLALNVDVAGTLDLTAGTLRIDASLHDSQVAGFELTGDMAVRAAFLDSPTFLVAFGGFHPEFDPQEDFPSLARLGIALDTGDDLRIQLGGYFALTSNTVQFGAEFSFWASGLGFTAEGGTSLDALIQFVPFGFRINVEFWISISAGSTELLGVLLTGDLSGPNPWYVAGTATFKILGFKKSLVIDATFGDREDEEPRAVVYVTDLLIAELSLPDAWSAVPPSDDGDGVLLADATEDETLRVHPSGRVRVCQRLVPLDTRIDHYGNATLGDGDTFTLASPRLGGRLVSSDQVETVEDWFAAASYFQLAEDEKLEAPSFEEMTSGLVLGDDGVDGGGERTLVYDHEVVYRDPNGRAQEDEHTGTLYAATAAALSRAVRTGAALQTRFGAGLPRSTMPASPFGVREDTYVALSMRTGEVARGVTPRSGTSYFAARNALAAADSAVKRIIVPSYEPDLMP